jgi:hypothetical protein
MWKATMLVLLMRAIYHMSHWYGFKRHDIYISSFMKTGIGVQAILKFCLRNLRGRNVDITDGKELWSAPLRPVLLALKHCWSISTGSCLTTLFTSLISLRATIICLPAWRIGWHHRASTITRTWWKVSKLLWHTHTKAYSPTRHVLNSGGDYIEKQLKYVRIFRIQ